MINHFAKTSDIRLVLAVICYVLVDTVANQVITNETCTGSTAACGDNCSYVSPNGSDVDGCGSYSYPCGTIGHVENIAGNDKTRPIIEMVLTCGNHMLHDLSDTDLIFGKSFRLSGERPGEQCAVIDCGGKPGLVVHNRKFGAESISVVIEETRLGSLRNHDLG